MPHARPHNACQEKPSASSLAFVAGGKKTRWARRKLAGVPRIVWIAGVVAILLAVVGLTNIVYQVTHKPTELFAFVGHRLDKEPAEPWRQLVGRVRLALANPPCFVTRPWRLFLPARPAPWRAYRDRACSRARRALPRPAFEA